MNYILAVLLGISDVTLCGYVLRAIKSPRGRVDLLRSLLRLAPNNKNLPAEFDFAIDEFWEINLARNDVVHAEWWSHENGSVFAVISDKHGLGIMDSREVKFEELRDLSARINKHTTFITRLGIDYLRLQMPQDNFEQDHRPLEVKSPEPSRSEPGNDPNPVSS